ncbi:MAG: FixH family protein [Sphingomonadaceae bacterium]
MTREFTGKHFALIMVIGFGIVMAVNFTMAGYATSGFSGVVVENSYVASQKYNGWLEQAREQGKLGWNGPVSRTADGALLLDAPAIPAGAEVRAELRRPIGVREELAVVLEADGSGRFVSTEPVAPGRWTVRMIVTANGQAVRFETEVQ